MSPSHSQLLPLQQRDAVCASACVHVCGVSELVGKNVLLVQFSPLESNGPVEQAQECHFRHAAFTPSARQDYTQSQREDFVLDALPRFMAPSVSVKAWQFQAKHHSKISQVITELFERGCVLSRQGSRSEWRTPPCGVLTLDVLCRAKQFVLLETLQWRKQINNMVMHPELTSAPS